MDRNTYEQIETLRAELAFLSRTVRVQGAVIEGLMDSLERYADASAVSMQHMVLALHAASELPGPKTKQTG